MSEDMFAKLWRSTRYDERSNERKFVEKVAARFNWPLGEAYERTAAFRAKLPV